MSIFDLITLGILDFFGWYAQEIMSGSDLLKYFIRQLAMYILLQLLFLIFPFIKRAINMIWFPFSFLHVYLHIYTAKEISRDLDEKKEEGEELDSLLDRHFVRSGFITGLGRRSENTMIISSFNRVKYAKQVAMAPSKFGWVLLAGYLIITPLAIGGSIITGAIGAFVHLYFFIGIFGVMMPTMEDWMYVLNTLIISLNIRPIYFFNAVIIHIIFTLDTFWRTNDFLIAIVIGSIMFVLYIWGLIFVASYALKGKLKRPTIFFVPFEKRKKETPLGVDFSLENFETDEI